MKLRYPTVEGVKILQQLLIDRFEENMLFAMPGRWNRR